MCRTALALLLVLGCSEPAPESPRAPAPPARAPREVTPSMFGPFEPYPNAQYVDETRDIFDVGETVTFFLSTTDDFETVSAFYQAHHGALTFRLSPPGAFVVRSNAGPTQDLVGIDADIMTSMPPEAPPHGTSLRVITYFGSVH